MTPIQYAVAGILAVLLLTLGFKEWQYLSIKAEYNQYKADVATGAAKANSDAAAAISTQAGKDQTATINHLAGDKADALKTVEDINAIHNAPKTDDGPVAPVLLRTIDSLRQR